METKTMKIDVPNGYEIDQEKSTFENIVLKKVDEAIITWNKNYKGVEIKSGGEHFILDGNPDYYMLWDDAKRFYNNQQFWNLPTINQLKVVQKNFDKINNVIKKNGGFVISKTDYWTIEEYYWTCALYVHMYYGMINFNRKNSKKYVRAVSTL